MCHTYRNLSPKEDYQSMAQDSTKNACNELRRIINELRQNDAPTEQIDKAREIKALCLDAIDACKSCNKERPKIKEALIRVK